VVNMVRNLLKEQYPIIDRIIEVGIYLYIIFMFLTIGEAIRNILLFGSFILWLATLRHRDNKGILLEPLSLFFWCFIITILVSVVFSIDPGYSFKSLAGEPLKSTLLFPLISTVIRGEERLKRLVYVFLALLIFTISIGYYSYWAYDLPLMKPFTPLRRAWHNRFAVDLNTMFPFAFLLLLISKRPALKIAMTAIILTGVAALVLSTSRGGLIAFISLTVVWSVYAILRKGVSLKSVLAGTMIIVLVSGITVQYGKPDIKERFLRVKNDMETLNYRTIIWSRLIAAVAHRPMLGWGYGPEIFKMDQPFQNTPYKTSPAQIGPDLRQPHNAFLRVLFHQGIIGLSVYVLMLFYAITIFLKESFTKENIRSYVLLSAASILISTYGINSIVENTHLLYLTLVLSIGMAAKGLDENCHS